MKTKQFTGKILLIVAFSLIFWACNDENETSNFEAFADAYVLKKEIDGEVKYAATFFVYGNKAISSATVTPPAGGGGSFELAATEESVYSFYKEPREDDFTSELPLEGNYLFEVVSASDESLEKSDLLENGSLSIPTITDFTYQPASESADVKWESVANADGYVVRLLDTGGKVIFLSYSLSAGADELSISPVTGNWAEQAYSGENYTLQLQAFSYEPGITDEELLAYNVKEISITETQITWGQ